MYWTLVVFLVPLEPIVVDGFNNLDDCRFAGTTNLEYVQRDTLGKPIQRVKYACARTDVPPVRCYPDTRTYGRTGECLLKPPVQA